MISAFFSTYISRIPTYMTLHRISCLYENPAYKKDFGCWDWRGTNGGGGIATKFIGMEGTRVRV